MIIRIIPKQYHFVNLAILFSFFNIIGQNPIVKNKGLNDPHIHIFNDTAYIYASHDKSIKNDKFIMDNWWVWSSPDLVNWTKRSVLDPKDTYIGKAYSRCWATDAAEKDGKYYWYFSEGNEQSGVVVGDTPVGPWKNILNKPLLKSELTPTHEYDMAVFEDNGSHYIIFGVWDYYIAKLNYDMISLAEAPKKIIINNARGPYNLDGKNKEKPTDDKPFLHKKNGKYYLSWGCFYATSQNIYGPYNYKKAIINKDSFAKGYDSPTWPTGFLQGRHGSFFEWNNQSYFTYCDISQTGNRYFRDTFISYVHYKKNGDIATIRIDGVGVGQYDLKNKASIQAEDYFKADGISKKEIKEDFVIETNANKSYLNYPNINNLKGYSKLLINAFAPHGGEFYIEIRKNGFKGEKIAAKNFKLKAGLTRFENLKLNIRHLNNKEGLYVLIEQKNNKKLQINSFSFLK